MVFGAPLSVALPLCRFDGSVDFTDSVEVGAAIATEHLLYFDGLLHFRGFALGGRSFRVANTRLLAATFAS